MGNIEQVREQIYRGDRQRLGELRALARQGYKLKPPSHLQAALAATRAYRATRGRIDGGRDAFCERALERLDLYGRKPETFNISKHTLARSLNAITPEVRARYAGKPLPHKDLAHYLAVIRTAAEIDGVDIEAAEIAFLKELPIWQTAARMDAADETWEAIENLSNLLRDLGTQVAEQAALASAFRLQENLSMRWDALHERITLVRNNQVNTGLSPVHPQVEIGVNFDEQRPLPSVPLVRVPVGWGDVELEIEMGSACVSRKPGMDRPAGQWQSHKARMMQFREVRLALAFINDREVGPVLMSRGAVGANFDWLASGTSMIWGTCHWRDTLAVQQEVFFDGGWRRVRLPVACTRDHEDFVLDHVTPGKAGDWDWEFDPIGHPGSVTMYGADHVSFTRLTPDHLHHWLVTPHPLDGMEVICPWGQTDAAHVGHEYPVWLTASGDFEAYWNDVPVEALTCPNDTPARIIETNLYNGRLEAALREAATRVVDQTHRVMEQNRMAAQEAQLALRARWTDRKPFLKSR
ncbi:hypothetical protein AAFO90_20620 [Phaeobacter sp. CAU 1743]|uniref:hypothetical protein n=1 Tax=Phaeobacter sp. CAU 1743 TaxID=3140367 RepID=UPI0023B41753